MHPWHPACEASVKVTAIPIGCTGTESSNQPTYRYRADPGRFLHNEQVRYRSLRYRRRARCLRQTGAGAATRHQGTNCSSSADVRSAAGNDDRPTGHVTRTSGRDENG